MLNLKDGTLWQWDTGRKIIITLEDGHTIDKVQFYNGIGDSAYPATFVEIVEGEIIAGIPNSLLCYANNLTVYLMTTDEDGAKTTDSITLAVNKRAKPEDYIFTDDEIMTYRVYNERLQYLQDNIVLPEKVEEAVNKEVTNQIPNWSRQSAPDATLSQAGEAADAKVTGLRITSAEDSIGALTGRVNNLIAYEEGTKEEGLSIPKYVVLPMSHTPSDYIKVIGEQLTVMSVIVPSRTGESNSCAGCLIQVGLYDSEYNILGNIIDVPLTSIYPNYSIDVSAAEYVTFSFYIPETQGAGAVESVVEYVMVSNSKITDLTELTDIRVGFDGTKYKTAGEAVREQVGKVNGKLDEVSKSTNNLFNIDTVYTHTVINKNTSGEHIVKASNDWNLSDFIEVEPGTKYEFKAFDGLDIDYRLIVYSYDDTKTPTTDVTYGTNPNITTSFSSKRTKVFTTSDTCKYVRLQYQVALDDCVELQLTTEANYVDYYIPCNSWIFPNVSEVQEIAGAVLDASIDGIAIDSGYGNENSSGSSNGLNLGEPISTTNLFSVMMNTLKQDGLFNSRIKIGDGFTHDSTVSYYDGSFYVTAVANNVDRGDSESSTNARTVLYKVTPNKSYTEDSYSQDATVTSIEIAKHGDSISNHNIKNGAGNPNAILINGVIRSIFLVTINDIRQSCYRDYNCNNGTLGTPSPLILDGGTFDGWINGCIAYDGSTYYYGTMCKKANVLHSSVLVKSRDCINWETVKILDEDNAQYEVATAYYSDKLYTATRVLTGLKVRELTPTGEELGTWEINCSNSRPAFFVYHDKLYLAFNGYDRFKMYIAKFTGSNWAVMMESDIHNIYPSFIVVDDEIYLSSTHNSSTSVYLSIVSHSALETTALTNIRKLKGALEWLKLL